MLALLATISGAETCVDITLFSRSKEALLRRFLRLASGVPSHDTFSRVFRLHDPAAFGACFARYVATLAERIEGVVAAEDRSSRTSNCCSMIRRPCSTIRRKRSPARREPPALGSPSTFSGTSAWARTRDARSCPVARAGGAC
jgi:hypothetical protein